MTFRYTRPEVFLKRLYRKFFPVPKSPYTVGYVADICSVNLVPPEHLKEFFHRSIEKLQSVKGKEIGDYLEFGVFNGTSMIAMYETCRALGIQQTRFIGFDSFQGLPAGGTDEDDGVWSKGMYSCSFEDFQKCLLRKNIQPDEVTLVKGWYQETLTEETRKNLNVQNVGIIFIDCDTYQSSKKVLEFIRPFLNQPLVLCFDDWKLNDLDIKEMGEYKAFNEFLDENSNLFVEEIQSYNRKSKSFFVRPR